MRRIFSERFHDGVIVRDVDHFYLVNLQRHDLADGCQGERLIGASHRYFTVADLRREHFVGQHFFIKLVVQLQRLDTVKKLDDLFVGPVAKRAQKCGGKKFAAAFASIEIDVQQIGCIELHLNPGTAVRDDAKAVKHLTVEVDS